MSKHNRPRIAVCHPFGIGLAVATKPSHLEWCRRRFPGADCEPPSSAATMDIIGSDPASYDVLVWVDRKRPAWRSPRDRAVVAAHEGAHVAKLILDRIGEPSGTTEVYAYLTDWAAGHIWDALHGA